MSFLTRGEPHAMSQPADLPAGARLIPRITIQAFCEHSQTAELVEAAIYDRRMSKVALTTHNGGLEGAIETYSTNPTPNLILVETSLPPEEIPAALERLAELCDATTRVIVLGHLNDVMLYRELIRSGVSEYIILPASAQTIVTAITELFATEGAAPIGRTIGFVSAKGGAGGSTVAHNVAWAISQQFRQDVLIIDTDFAFGTAALNFNQDPPQGLADAMGSGQKLDQLLLDRLISKAANHISLLAAPVMLDRTFDFSERDLEEVIDLCQRNTPVVILDLPHDWSSWVRYTLASVDEIIIVAEPDLANLRNTKNLSDAIKALRPAESEPLLVVNKVGLPRRPEIDPEEFAASAECHLLATIGFDAATYGTAANNGQMIAEVSAGHRSNDVFRAVATHVTGRDRPEAATGKPSSFHLPSFLTRKRA